ncbi:Golgi apparatus membrane protein tvp18 [Scheffersomyces spartinae]|uniref:Golgi apparatus membrane protein TVP18 n=1 Tax=Scheffersomyces spartinae TaxID=45513 RepID=A0A9P8AI95_9ASCO|nr:Golgi apparatus membrane protein tvp18 [Scheffersomyces spartinae]KAG7192884.1 Golgi apparatus membrane protein tvp18 [Scheffersomyces spartinae]
MALAQDIGSNVGSLIFSTFSSDFKKKNFSLYGQWIALFTVFLCLALGIANIFHFNLVIIFSIICLIQGLVVIVVEIPFLLRICPFTDKFTNFIRAFDNNLPRCGFYLLLGVIQWLSLTLQATSLIVVAVFFTLASACYGLAALKHQDFIKSSFQSTQAANDLETQIGNSVTRNVL